jgi:hypothetical protein
MAMMRWFVALEAEDARGDAFRGGWPLLAAAIGDGLIDAGDEDGFALAMLHLHERKLVFIDLPLLETDQGAEMFRRRPSYQLQEATGVYSLPDGKGWVSGAAPSATFNVAGSTVGQIAGHDITNLTVSQFVELVEQAIDGAEAPAEAKAEARGWIRVFREALSGGGAVARDAAVGVLSRAAQDMFGTPPV